MKKNLRYIIAFLLALMMLLSLCACAQTGTAGNSGELDLDYVGEDTDQPEEEKPWYSWFTEAFSFGKKDTAPTAPSKPDSVADFYAFTKDSFRLEGYEPCPFEAKIPIAV